jgi:hypothetical protein
MMNIALFFIPVYLFIYIFIIVLLCYSVEGGFTKKNVKSVDNSLMSVDNFSVKIVSSLCQLSVILRPRHRLALGRR